MTTSEHNPYQPPNSNVTPPSSEPDGEFVPGGQTVSVESGFTWIGGSWQLFKSAPGMWIVNIILMFVLSMVASLVPVIGFIANMMITPILIGGLILGCKSIEDGHGLDVSHLFAGFKEKAGPLATLGLIFLAFTIAVVVAMVILIIITFGATLLSNIGNQQAMASAVIAKGLLFALLLVLVWIALFIPVSMAMWFAPALIVLQNLAPVEALKQSFKAGLRNFLPFLVFGIVFFVLLIVAVIPIGLGLLILIPMGYASIYVAYKDIFLKRD
jgi:uncharacterized membrane protein